MDTGIVTRTSRQDDPSHSAQKVDPSQNSNTSQSASSSGPTVDSSQNASTSQSASSSRPTVDSLQNASTSQSASSSRPTVDHSPFSPEKDEKVVKLDDFDSFLDYFQKKYVSSWTRANTESNCIILRSSLPQSSLVSSYSPKRIGGNSRKFAKKKTKQQKH